MTPARAVCAACLTTLLARATSEVAHCDLAVVGAGAGGALAAWRASEAGWHVCVFELRDRPGGRIHSLRGQGAKQDLVVEAGAYRFAPQPVCEPLANDPSWCIFTPITTAIVEFLGLSTGVYDPNPKLWDHKMRKLVDGQGQDVGYLRLVETMLQRAMERGAHVFYNSEVTSLSATENSAVQLSFAKGGSVSASAVLLNVPQNPLLKLLRHSGPPFGTVFSAPLHDPESYSIMKLYVHYEDAWWRNYLGLTSGAFGNENDGSAQSPAPLSGQYHDGDVRCDGPNRKCRGFLQAYYSSGAEDFYKAYHPQDGESAVHLSHDSAEQHQLLTMVHMALLELHREALDKINMTEYVAQMLPDSGVLSIWSDVVSGIQAGCHSPKEGMNPSPEDLPSAALRPFKGWPVFVADEAFGPLNCWAEGSLNMSCSALEVMGLQRPLWLNESFVGQSLRAPPPRTDPFLIMPKPSVGAARAASKELVV